MKTIRSTKTTTLLLALTLLALVASNAVAQVSITPNRESSEDAAILLQATVPGEGTSDEGETF